MVISERVGIAPLEDKMRETRLRWFGHVKRTSVDAPVSKCKTIDLRHYRRGRGRPKMSQNEVIRGDLDFLELKEDVAHDRNLWRLRIKMVDNRYGVSYLLP